MYSKDIRKDDVIIREGDTGSHIYVLEGNGVTGSHEHDISKHKITSKGQKVVEVTLRMNKIKGNTGKLALYQFLLVE